MDGGPLSAVIAESHEVGCDIVTPEMSQDRPMSLGRYTCRYSVFMCVCALLILGVSSLGNDPSKLCRPACIYLKPVNSVL